MIEQKNLILAIVLSLAILVGFQFLFERPRQQAEQAARQAQQQQAQTQPVAPAQPPAPGQPALVQQAPAQSAGLTRDQALARSPRVEIRSPRLTGSIALDGARLDDVVLPTYRVTVAPDSPNIVLLQPSGAPHAYYAEFGWVPGAGVEAALPKADTRWTADRTQLTPESPVTLSWDNGQGLRFLRRYEIDRDFLVTVTESVENTGTQPLSLHPYALVSRSGTPEYSGMYILHEGFVGVLGGRLKEQGYDKSKEFKSEEATTGGWLGITDKYWLVSLIPNQSEPVQARFTHAIADDRYQADYLGAPRARPPGGRIEATHRLFAGAKEVRVLERYEEQLGIQRFDYAVDWGWFHFLTRPIFKALDFLYHLVGNFGIAILLLTVAIKALFFPLANRSYVMMSRMKLLTPEMMKLRERYGDDRQKMNAELMGLYKKHKVNPLSGCLPILLQIPVFFSLYKVLFVTIEMRHAPFYGWIRDLSAPDPTSFTNLFGLLPYSPPEVYFLGAGIGIWPLIMGVTMWLQQKLNPQPADPVQAKVFMFMPIIFTVMLASFASGLVIYWAWNNLLSIAQQWVIMRRMGIEKPTA